MDNVISTNFKIPVPLLSTFVSVSTLSSTVCNDVLVFIKNISHDRTYPRWKSDK